MEEKRIDFDYDYEHQPFDELEINPYELVIAVSKAAREINTKAQKYLGPESPLKPINLALGKIKREKIDFEYQEQNAAAGQDSGQTGDAAENEST